MCCNRFKKFALLTVAGALLVAATGVAVAQEQQSKGRIVRIGEDDQGQATLALPAPNNDAARQQQPAYWIGLAFGPVSPELRAHIDLPEGQGLLVREIVPGSPAAKSILKQYDILLRANDNPLTERSSLVDTVRTAGEKQGQITFEVLRKGQRQSITVKPESRPANVAQNEGGFGQGELFQGDPSQMPMLGQMRRLFGELGENGQLQLRDFGPGIVVGNGGGNLPDGVSISVKKENNQPARVTVKRGGQTWEAVEGDQDSLDSLPADLLPHVERLLGGAGGNRLQLFRNNGAAPAMNFPGNNDAMQKRMEALERRMQQMMERLSPGAEKPAGEQAK